MTATFAETSGDTVYIYVRGRLVMTRKPTYTVVMHVAPAGVRVTPHPLESTLALARPPGSVAPHGNASNK